MSVLVDKVEIYSKANCQYCNTAKTVVTRREWPMEEKSIDDEANLTELTTKLGHAPKSVPQIFINGEHIGGYQKLVEWIGKHAD
jgi:glutaredoxin 3